MPCHDPRTQPEPRVTATNHRFYQRDCDQDLRTTTKVQNPGKPRAKVGAPFSHLSHLTTKGVFLHFFFQQKKNTLLMTIMTAVSVPSSSSSSSYFGNSASSSQLVMITKIYFYPDRPASHCPDAGKLCLRERKHFYLDVAFATCCRRNLNLAGGAVFRITCRDRLVRTFFVLAKLSYNVKDYYSI